MNSVFSQQLSRSFGHQSKMQQYYEQHKKEMSQETPTTATTTITINSTTATNRVEQPQSTQSTEILSTSPTSSYFRFRAIFEGISKKRHNSISISTTNYEGNSNFLQEPKSGMTRSISFEKCEKNEQATDPFL